ncbi:MAG TPA: ABC transporter permease [Candidatus Dormibacteraeota bacterium]|nr:ABC transporter permease [Candidatus Dormibacteraeota bacterium]
MLTSAPAAPPAWLGVPARAARVWWREYLGWRHMFLSSTLLNFGQPLMWLTTFGVALGAYISLGRPGGYLAFVAPGLLATTAMNVVTFDALFGTYLKLHEWGTYEAVVSTPVGPGDIVRGIFSWQSTRALLFGSGFCVVMAAFGLLHHWTALWLGPVLLGTGPLFAAPAMAWAAVFRRFHHLFYYTELIIAPMFFFSGAFFPTDRLPGAVRLLVGLMPLSHVVTLCRALVAGRPDPTWLLDIGYPAALTAILGVVAVRLMAARLTR